MTILAIDPGTAKSAWVLLKDGVPEDFGMKDNADMLHWLTLFGDDERHELVIEMIDMGGMIAGREVFETCVWIGRFMQAYPWSVHRITRVQVKMALCGSPRAKDPNIRQALIDRFGGAKAIAGKRCSRCKATGKCRTRGKEFKCPKCHGSRWSVPRGALHGIASHEWAALAVGIAWTEQQTTEGAAA